MIKLLDILAEIEQNRLTPQERKTVDDLLFSLEEDQGAFLQKVGEYFKKGLLTAGVISALLASPNISKADKLAIGDITKGGTPTTTTTGARTTTDVDGILGSVTSKYQIPGSFNISSKKDTTDTGVKGNEYLSTKFMTKDEMSQWNAFINWLKANKYSGSLRMDNIDYSRGVLAQYRKINPNFYITLDNYTEKVEAVQKTLRDYKQSLIDMIKKGDKSVNIGTTSPDEIMPGILITGKDRK